MVDEPEEVVEIREEMPVVEELPIEEVVDNPQDMHDDVPVEVSPDPDPEPPLPEPVMPPQPYANLPPFMRKLMILRDEQNA
jgi:hypothetical protein